MATKHKHCDIIKAWADGEEIEYRCSDLEKWKPIPQRPYWMESVQYRVKPKVAPVFRNVWENGMVGQPRPTRGDVEEQSSVLKRVAVLEITSDGEVFLHKDV